jgi:hypothetical protein
MSSLSTSNFIQEHRNSGLCWNWGCSHFLVKAVILSQGAVKSACIVLVLAFIMRERIWNSIHSVVYNRMVGWQSYGIKVGYGSGAGTGAGTGRGDASVQSAGCCSWRTILEGNPYFTRYWLLVVLVNNLSLGQLSHWLLTERPFFLVQGILWAVDL